MDRKKSYMNLIVPKEQQLKSLKNVTLKIDQIVENEHNVYELVDIEKLESSIIELGLLTPILTKPLTDDKFLLVAGHRRFTAIKNLIEAGELPKDFLIPSTLVSPEEDDIVTRLKLHETNIQTRSLKDMNNDEREKVVSDYMNLITEAKEKGIEIDGKKLKGKTRDLVAERFNIGTYLAQKIINNVKEEGNSKKDNNKKTPTEKTVNDKAISFNKQLKKIYDFIYDFKQEIEDDILEEISKTITDIEDIL